MAPGFPNEDEITPEEPKTVTPRINATPNNAVTFQDRLDDIRDAIVETQMYDSLSKRVVVARKVMSSVYDTSKRVAWVVGTSALVLVIPLLYEIDKELGPGVDPSAPATNNSPTSSATPSTPAPSSADAAPAANLASS